MSEISFKINIEEAIRYMGYRSAPDERQLETIRSLASMLEEQLRPAWVYRVFGLEFKHEGVLLSGTSILLGGKDIRRHLNECDRAVLMCATVSLKADELIRQKEREDISLGFMTDCLASAAVEAVCAELENELYARISGKYFTWRFSPGYGDLPLDIQPQIIDVLNAGKRAGVICNDAMMLVPSKSVTAMIGLSDKPIEKSRQGCAVCDMSDKCQFRRRGDHCGL